MKKTLAVAVTLILFIGMLAFAGPFVDFSLTLPQTADITVGIKTDGFTAGIAIDDLLTVPWMIGFKSSYKGEYGWWDAEFKLDVNDIDLFTNYPIPTVGGFVLGAKETIHLGTLLASEGDLDPAVFDLRAGVQFEYNPGPQTLTPEISIGFHWEG